MHHFVIVRAIVVVLMVTSLIGCGVQPTAPISESPSETPNSATDLSTESPLASVTSLPGRIFFTRAGGQYGDETIFSANADGSVVTGLTNMGVGFAFPAWSPDGTKIAFSPNSDGNSEIYVMNADGSDLTRLTDNPANDGAPSWSPDGTQITFSSERDGNSEIYAMNADGSGQMRLTDNPTDDEISIWQP